jgi:hypothetical protein
MATIHSIQGDAVAWREVDGEFVLISVATTRYYSLNASGSDVWRILLDGPRTGASIAAVLARHHGSDPVTVAADVEALLEDLVGEGLLQSEEGSEPPAGGAPRLDANGGYQPPSLLKYEALERLILSGE